MKKNRLRKLLVCIVVVVWFFSGFLHVFNYHQADAQTPSTLFPGWRLEFSIGEVMITVDKDGLAEIANDSLGTSLPSGSGELELYALPDNCIGSTLVETKRNLLTYPYCGDPIGFVLAHPKDYTWKPDPNVRYVIGACKSQDIDCGDHPEEFMIGFISKKLTSPQNISQTLHLNSEN